MANIEKTIADSLEGVEPIPGMAETVTQSIAVAEAEAVIKQAERARIAAAMDKNEYLKRVIPGLYTVDTKQMAEDREKNKDAAAIQALIEASLAVAKMRYRGNQTLTPCWCEVQGVQCEGQPQCHKATDALQTLNLSKFMIEYREATKEVK